MHGTPQPQKAPTPRPMPIMPPLRRGDEDDDDEYVPPKPEDPIQ